MGGSIATPARAATNNSTARPLGGSFQASVAAVCREALQEMQGQGAFRYLDFNPTQPDRSKLPAIAKFEARDTAWAMSEENVELVREAMEALLRRDRDAWFAIHDEDFELVPIRDWPETGARGREAAWNFNMRILESFEWAPIEVERVDAEADKVLVHPRYEARGAGSGVQVEHDYWAVATVRQGRILRVQWFTDHAQALEAAGLSE